MSRRKSGGRIELERAYTIQMVCDTISMFIHDYGPVRGEMAPSLSCWIACLLGFDDPLETAERNRSAREYFRGRIAERREISDRIAREGPKI
jgi:hypothetical protein